MKAFTNYELRAQQVWVYEQLEPNDQLKAGNAKRYKPEPKVHLAPPDVKINEWEDSRLQDEYLALHGAG